MTNESKAAVSSLKEQSLLVPSEKKERAKRMHSLINVDTLEKVNGSARSKKKGSYSNQGIKEEAETSNKAQKKQLKGPKITAVA